MSWPAAEVSAKDAEQIRQRKSTTLHIGTSIRNFFSSLSESAGTVIQDTMAMITIEPPPTHGINTWVMRQARICQIKGALADEAIRLIYQAGNGNLRRPWQPREVERAVEKVYSTPCETSEQPKQEKPHWKAQRAIATGSGKTLEDLRGASPFPKPWENRQHEFVRALFPASGGLLCIGKSAQIFGSGTIEQFGRERMAQAALIVPAYLTVRKGLTQDGKLSAHCLANTGKRRFCVCDFDEPPPVTHPRLIFHLARMFRLVMAISSGGKSLHAWFAVPEEMEADFWTAAIEAGADAAIMRNRSSFVRMPGGLRDNGNRQTVHYFDIAAAKYAEMLNPSIKSLDMV